MRPDVDAAPLVPLLIRSSGRSGSTLLMQVLGTARTVCFERTYPFEHRYLSYAHQLARMIRLPARESDTWNNEVLFHGTSHQMGCLPYGDIAAFDREAVSTSAYLATWRSFSAGMRAAAGLDPHEPGFYAEKAPPPVAEYANEHLQARNLFLLRDPRDEMVSIKAFNAKRGFAAFGWCPEDDDLSYARKLAHYRRHFLQLLVDFESGPRRHCLRYEDLVENGAHEVARLSDWLGVALDLERASSDAEVRAVHMTAPDARASVERWRTELHPDARALFSDELGDELRALGYAA